MKLGLTERQWSTPVLGTEIRYWRAIGSAQSLIAKAATIGQSWLKRIASAESLIRLRPTRFVQERDHIESDSAFADV